jgi:hypothetical protein
MAEWRGRPAATRRSDLFRAREDLLACLLERGAAYADLVPDIQRLAPRPAEGRKGRAL